MREFLMTRRRGKYVVAEYPIGDDRKMPEIIFQTTAVEEVMIFLKTKVESMEELILYCRKDFGKETADGKE